jgi:type I restriction enzyme S subunit
MSNGQTYVGDMLELAYGRSLSADNRKAGTVPVYGSNGIVGYHNVSAIEGPGIVVGRKGSVGALAFSNGPFWPIDTTYYVINKGAHDWRFLYHFLRSLGLTGLNSHSAVPGLNREDVYSIGVSLPAREEESVIGQVLDQLEEAIVREDSTIGGLQKLKRIVMRDLFTRGLRGEAQKETEFGAVPESWIIAHLDAHAQVQTGAAKGRKFGTADTVEVPYLRVANVQDGHLDLREMKTIQIRESEVERYRLRDGDVVLTEGGDFDKLGRGFIWKSELDLCIHQNHVFAVRPDPEVLIPEFFAYLAQSPYGKAYFLKVAHKTTNLACINSTKLKAFPLLIPPEQEEQREIVVILQSIDAKIDLHKRKKLVLEELFRALLHKLMTGEIRVADLNLSALETNQEVAV